MGSHDLPKTPQELAEEQRLTDEREAKKLREAQLQESDPSSNLGSILMQFFQVLIQAIFGGSDQGIDAEDNENADVNANKSNANRSFTGKMKIGRIAVSDQAVAKWKTYLAEHSGEKVEFQSPVANAGSIASGFGARHTHIKGASTDHKGADIKATGDVLAAANGIVLVSGKYGTAGNTVIIGQPDGTFTTYMHLRDKSGMPPVGTVVEQGQKIGIVGNTSTLNISPHLHFEMRDRNGQAIEPEIAGTKLRKNTSISAAEKKPSAPDFASLTDRKTLPKLNVETITETKVSFVGTKPKTLVALNT